MKTDKIFKLLLVGALTIAASSCEDFLHRPGEDSYNTSNFYQNDAQCLQGVNYLYNSPWYDFQRGFIKVGEVMSGNMYWGSCPYLSFTTNSTDVDLVNMSYSLWAVNGHVNAVIDNILRSEGPSQKVKNQAIGEAITLKALAYFYLVRTFGEVPIIHNNTELLNADYNSVRKNTRANVYDYIIMNLEKAMELLPKKTSNWDNRIDYYAAEALLAKVYLTKAGLSGSLSKDDLTKAANYAKDVIDNSGRSLTPVYSDIFRLSPSVYNQTGEPLISWMWTCEGSDWTRQNTLQSDLGVEGFSGIGDIWGGWGGPSYDLMLAFGADPLNSPASRANELDTRRKATCMMVGDKYEYFWTDKGGFDFLRFMYDEDYANLPTGKQFEGPCGAQNVKHLFGNEADHLAALGYNPGRMAYTLPTHVLRLGDLYLVYAEACLLNGNSAEALEYVNKIRSRAGAPELTSVSYDDIWKERRLELAGEGDRWYDFVRRSYYDIEGAKKDILAQKRNNVYSYGEAASNYFETGVWSIDPSVTCYNTDDPAPKVDDSIFTLPLAQEDVINNPHLLEEAVEVDVRETYKYNF